jgi:hypothetical protein
MIASAPGCVLCSVERCILAFFGFSDPVLLLLWGRHGGATRDRGRDREGGTKPARASEFRTWIGCVLRRPWVRLIFRIYDMHVRTRKRFVDLGST